MFGFPSNLSNPNASRFGKRQWRQPPVPQQTIEKITYPVKATAVRHLGYISDRDVLNIKVGPSV